MELLKIENCRKSFDGEEILKGISLSVSEGEVVSVIGPSGSGKSTLLRCACMLEVMDGGSLSYAGKNAAQEEIGKVVLPLMPNLRRYARPSDSFSRISIFSLITRF